LGFDPYKFKPALHRLTEFTRGDCNHWHLACLLPINKISAQPDTAESRNNLLYKKSFVRQKFKFRFLGNQKMNKWYRGSLTMCSLTTFDQRQKNSEVSKRKESINCVLLICSAE
jgi:hypothetical protein